MLTREAASAFCDGVIARSESDATEVVVVSKSGNSLRLAESAPSEQNAGRQVSLHLRVARDGRQGRAEASSLATAAVERALAAAADAARLTPPIDLPPLAGASDASTDGGHDEAAVRDLAEHAPETKVAAVVPWLDEVRSAAAVATGFYETEGCTVSYATSNGCFRHAARGRAWFSSTVLADDGAGVAHRGTSGMALTGEQVTQVGRRALDKALTSRNPRELPAGDYPVVLEPQAVGDLLLFLSWAGFGAREFLDGSSFLSGKIGDRVLSERITIRDAASHPEFREVGFDLEGQDRRDVTLIEAGVARGPVFDRPTAREAGTQTTGHGGLQPSASGPSASCLTLDAASDTAGDLLSGMERGLLVTQFHYTNLIDPLPVTVTGMTRNGTFLVEHGAVVGPVKNLRFTQSLVEAFSNVEAVGEDPTLIDAFFGGTSLTPSLRLGSFRFTSTTEF